MSSTYPPFGGTPIQTCLRCGRQLPHNISYCASCGYTNPTAQRSNPIGHMPPTTSQLSWDSGMPNAPSRQEQERGQGNVQWGQLPVPPLQNGFVGQQPRSFTPPTSTPPPLSPLPNKFAGQQPFKLEQHDFAGLPPLRPPDDQFPPLPAKRDGLESFPPLSPRQNSFVGQPAFPPSLGANGFPGSSGQAMNATNPFNGSSSLPNAGQAMNATNPFNGSGRLPNAGQAMNATNPFNGSSSLPNAGTGNLYSAMASSPPLNPAAMPASLRTGMLSDAPSPPLPPKKRRGPSAGVIIGIGLLIIVLIAGGLTSYMLFLNGSAPQTTTPSAPAVKDTPIFTDAFTNNNNGWNLQGDPGKFSAAVSNGKMVLEDDNHSLLWELVPGSKTFSNFKLAVDAVLSKGDQNNGYGVFIRGASNQNSELATYYRFALYGDGSYAIFKGSVDANGNTTNTRLQDYALDPAIKKGGGLNHIIVVANGPAMTLIVNGQPLKTVSDNSYTSGSVALFVINLNPSKTGGQATFSNFGIYQLQP
ncbi:MAG TPA: family 16 glycoside hydrolase [Ktedonobacteraceae bacterium]|nr:family 16 glycoside hydrolase [Ktedonobacteraceae bacterium]